MCAEHIEVCWIIASILDMFQCSTTAKYIVGNVENVIGLPVGQTTFEDGDAIEYITQSDLINKLMNECNTTVGDGLCLFGKFENDGRRGQLWCSVGSLGMIGTKGYCLLVIVNRLLYITFHLKSILGRLCSNTILAISAEKQG